MSVINVRVSKLNVVESFDVETLPEASRLYAIEYGLTQSINDSHASVMRKNFSDDALYLAAVQEKVNGRLAQIRSGSVPGSRVVVIDPVRQAAAKAGVSVDEIMKMIADLAAAKSQAPAPAKSAKK